MSTNYEQTKKAVLDAVRERGQQTKPVAIKTYNGAKALGQYLQKRLKNLEMSRVTFAQSLEMETELADAILDGVLPESELHSDLLAELADAVGCQFERLVQVLKGDSETPQEGWVSPV